MAKYFVPCHGCERRELGCFGKCDAYKEYKAAIEKDRESKIAWINAQDDYYGASPNRKYNKWRRAQR